jgi:anti-sigma factor RsiW
MLVLYRDGELAPTMLAAVTTHLGGCDSCREEYDRLCAARDWVRKQTAGGSSAMPPMGLVTLQARLKERIAERTRAGGRGGMLQLKVAAEIAPFLGHRAADRLLQSVSENGQDLLCVIEPVLANFLGEKAAAELVNHLVDSAIETI